MKTLKLSPSLGFALFFPLVAMSVAGRVTAFMALGILIAMWLYTMYKVSHIRGKLNYSYLLFFAFFFAVVVMLFATKVTTIIGIGILILVMPIGFYLCYRKRS